MRWVEALAWVLHDTNGLPFLLDMLAFPDVWEVLIHMTAYETGSLDQFGLVLLVVAL